MSHSLTLSSSTCAAWPCTVSRVSGTGPDARSGSDSAALLIAASSNFSPKQLCQRTRLQERRLRADSPTGTCCPTQDRPNVGGTSTRRPRGPGSCVPAPPPAPTAARSTIPETRPHRPQSARPAAVHRQKRGVPKIIVQHWSYGDYVPPACWCVAVPAVHNCIEYGMMASLAEGLNILRNADIGTRRAGTDAETAPM